MDDFISFIRLRDLVIQQKSRLIEYKNLFAVDDQDMRKFILNSTAPGFFRIVFDLFWSDMVLAVSKLTDPPTTRVKKKEFENLTVPRLVKNWASKDKAVFAELNTMLQELSCVASEVRTYRSKSVAHQDYEQAMKGTLSVQLATLEKAFCLVEKILNVHSIKVGLGYYGFDSEPVAGVRSLIHVLEEALIYRKVKSDCKSDIDN